MKRFLLLAMMAFAIVCFVGCSSDKDDNPGPNNTNLLIGKWRESASVHWTFDEKYVLVEDKEDIFDGTKTPYTYNETTKDLIIGGIVTFNVVELTSTTLRLTGWTNMSFTKVE